MFLSGLYAPGPGDWLVFYSCLLPFKENLGFCLKKLIGLYYPGPGLVRFKFVEPLSLFPILNPPCYFLELLLTKYWEGPGVLSSF